MPAETSSKMTNYVYYLWAAFPQKAKLAAEFQPHLNRYGQLELRGGELNPQIMAALFSALEQGKVTALYLTPFYFQNPGSEERQRRLINLWGKFSYGEGCGAAVLDKEGAAAYYHIFDAYTARRARQIDDEMPAQPPRVFQNFKQLALEIRNFIRTGSFDGSRPRPYAVSAQRRGVDPELLFWLENALGQPPQSLEELAAIGGLSLPNYIPGAYPVFPDWLAPEPGNWSLLGDLPNLKMLFLPELKLPDYSFLLHMPQIRTLGLSKTDLRDTAQLQNLPNVNFLELPAAELQDFTFLQNCPQLEILNLSRTDFRDCRLLTGLPALRLVKLPAERQLLYKEVLDPLPIQVNTYRRRSRGAGILPFDIIGPDENWLAAHPTIDLAPPYKALYIDADGEICEGADINLKYLQKLLSKVQEGRLGMVTVSLNPWGEEEFLEFDAAGGWATLSLQPDNDAEADNGLTDGGHGWYSIYNPEQAGNWEDAPPELGGQSPVPMLHAVDNLALAADCLAWYIKTGRLYPGAYWAKYYG